MTDQNKAKAHGIMLLIVICCVIMALIETVIEPVYAVKSAIKVVVFLLFPLIFAKMIQVNFFDHPFTLDRKGVLKLLALGLLIYAVIIGAYALTRNFFDYPSLVRSLSADQKVASSSFIWVALYISFCNSFLEEFLFRFAAFIQLSKFTARKTAYAFSSVLFAVYHISIIGTSFPLPLLFLALIGLTAGGYIFDFVDEKNETICNSWVIHMFADFAIMTVWYIHI